AQLMIFFYRLKVGVIALATALSVSAQANDSHGQLQANLRKLNPNISITRTSNTPVPGIIEVELGGSQIIYASGDGSYIFTGELIDITNGRNENLTAHSQQQIRRGVLATLAPTTFITYPATTEETSQVYVFTDTS